MPSNPPRADDFDEVDPFADDPNHEEIERRMNINRLKNEASEIVGGQMSTFEADDAPSEILEEFWKNVVEYERAPLVTMQEKLAVAGIEVPADSELDEADLTTKLWQIIEWMAENNTVLENTDHLSDRELYVWLRDDWFHERGADVPGSTCHTSPIGSYGEEEMVIYHRYYADEKDRESWMNQFPDYEMPPREEKLYNRDQFLPDSAAHIEFWREQKNESEEEGDNDWPE